ncbi:hypothetical protein D2Q93_13460 [Alicyclobacillaceae bacterium I2511]|nr:hypothetical protein D2Q93_13460 [Alicyclobacillaceae bacterium I2511]
MSGRLQIDGNFEVPGSSHIGLSGPSRIAMAVLAALWLAVFLWPLQDLGMLQGPVTFLPLFVVLAGVQVLPWSWLRPFAALLFSLAYVIHFFSPGPWQTGLLRVLHEEGQQLWRLIHVGQLPDLLATQLFLLCLMFLYWLVVYAAARERLWIFYNLLAVVVLAAIDGNTQVHPNVAGVVVVLTFVAVLGVHRFQQVRFVPPRTHRFLRYWVPLTGLVVLALAAALFLPKQGPIWPNPFAAWGWGTGAGVDSSAAQKVIGYQSDNAHLGGSFVPSHTSVLQVNTASPAYLRGEVYNEYTGKGWLKTTQASIPTRLGATLPQNQTFRNLPTQQVSQQVTVLSNSLRVPVLFAGYSLEKITADSSLSGQYSYGALNLDPETGEVTAGTLRKGETYTVLSREMGVPDGILRALPALPAHVSTAFPAGVRTLDTQVPSTLPADVDALARKLTQGMHSEYDIVQAVQAYLQNNYPYETTNIPVPGPKQDYVAQFLFQSKRGYCNNFSSAMAVMLRTLGIPTRWVTGFTEGTLNSQYTGSGNQYIVSNMDAHSWVEVYFPSVGWIPFDPTPNFNLPFAQTGSSAGGTLNPAGNNAVPAPTPAQHPATPQKPPAGGGAVGTAGPGLSVPWWGEILLLLMVGGVAWSLRHKVVEWRHHWVWRSANSTGMTRALQHLVRYLEKQGDLPKRAHTLRDLASVADSYEVPGEDYWHLVNTAEQVWYGQKQPDRKDIRRVYHTWWHWLLAAIRRK